VRLVDSHCHLQADRFDSDVNLVLGGARLAGVERLLVPGWDRPSCERALDLADRFPWLDVAVGVHPHDAANVGDDAWPWFVEMARDDRVVAVGETGLDFDRLFSPPKTQLANLRRNLALALEVGKPAILHCRSSEGSREAQDTLLAELEKAGLKSTDESGESAARPQAIVHSFSGPVDYAQAVLRLGLAISFSGLVFRAGEEASADVARLVPADRLLIETDSPFLSPPGAPRRRNEPEWVAVTGRWLAKIRGADPEPMGERLVASYDRILARANRG